MSSIDLTQDELSILTQTVANANYQGKYAVTVALLLNKLQEAAKPDRDEDEAE